jgi:hypothetical protein
MREVARETHSRAIALEVPVAGPSIDGRYDDASAVALTTPREPDRTTDCKCRDIS